MRTRDHRQTWEVTSKGKSASYKQPEPARDDHETIEKVMKVGMKGGLAKKIIEGKVSAEEKEKFLTLAISLGGTTVPTGSPESWKQKSSALIAASAAVVAGQADTLPAFKAAANCKSCHSVHKPKKKK